MSNSPTLWYVANKFKAERIRARDLGEKTLRTYHYTLLRFVHIVGEDRPVSTLAKKDIQDWMVEIGADVVGSTVRYRLSVIRRFCTWLVDQGYITRDPMIGIKPPRVPRRLPRALAAPDITKVLAKCPDVRAQLMVCLMCQEGLRCIEVARLQIGDIDEVQKAIRVLGKGGHERLLPLSDETLVTMGRYLAEHPAASGPLLRSYVRLGYPITNNYISTIVSRTMAAAGVKGRPYDGKSAHALRHSMATHMLIGGAHVRDVQRALGHAHLATTEVYLPLVVNDLREAMGGRSYRATEG